jgi:hypothetical protein
MIGNPSNPRREAFRTSQERASARDRAVESYIWARVVGLSERVARIALNKLETR